MDADKALTTALGYLTVLDSRRSDIEKLDDYYEGKQPLRFASREWAEFHKDQYMDFQDNWCGVVPDASNERLRVTALTVPGVSSRDEALLWRGWLDADLPAKSSQGFLQSMVAKRSFVSVWGNSNDEPVVAWEHPSQAYVDADPLTGARRGAIKSFTDGDHEYLTLLLPDTIWKWRRATNFTRTVEGVVSSGGVILPTHTASKIMGQVGGGFEPYQPRDDEVWPLPNPLGVVPVVEIPNRPRLMRGPMSDIAGVVAMQDAINLLWAYLFAAADHASLPARVVMGQQPPKIPVLDKDGQKIGEENVPLQELQKGRILWLTGQDASIGQWDSADLDAFLSVIERAIGHISSQVRVPAHYFVANTGLSNINGETLTATETPLVKKVEEFQLFSSSPLAEVFRLIAKVKGMDAMADMITSDSIRWANPAIRSDAQLADALSKKQSMGYPLEYLLELDGLPPTEIARVLEMAQRERLDPYMLHLHNKAEGTGGADEL